MNDIKTYEEMNNKICGLLRLNGDNVSLYAAQRIKELEAENASLHARLDKAVILPRIIHPNPIEWHIQYEYKSGIITSDIRRSEYAAEARLAELKGGEGE